MQEVPWIRHVAIGLVVREGDVLVGRRPPGSHLEGLWEFPGGQREPGEDLRECLERELTEETGLRLEEAVPLPPPLVWAYEDRTVMLFPFLCRAADSPPPASSWTWVARSELAAMPFPPANGPLLRFLARA